MSDDIVEPVNGIIMAFHKGTVKTGKICALAEENAAAAQVLYTIESVQALQKSLAESEALVRHVYFEGTRVCGKRYASAIKSDPATLSPLQKLTINIKDQVDNLSEYFEDPQTFDQGSFSMIRRDTERCRNQVVGMLEALHQHMLSIQQYNIPINDDRAQLSSQRPSNKGARSSSQISPMHIVAPQSFSSREVGEGRPIATRSSSASHISIPTAGDIPTGTLYGIPRAEETAPPTVVESSHRPREDSGVQLIDRAEVLQQVSSNEDFLEKRKRSRQSFRQGIEDLRQSSMSSTATASPRLGFIQTSPSLIYTAEFSASPVATSRPSSYYHLMARTHSREGQNGSSSNSLSPRNSVAIRERQDSSTSEPLTSGTPESQPHSGRQSIAEGHGSLSTTFNPPGYGQGVPDGIQAVGQLTSDDGLIPASETNDPPSPPQRNEPIGYPMRPDASFYKFNRFCPGAHMIRRGTKGAQEIRKKPGAHLTALISVKCTQCKYEISWENYDSDNFLDRAGIFTLGDIRFRHRFLSKCHMPVDKMEDSAYACIFCVDEGKTVDDYDATIFFSPKQLFRHLEKHQRPLKQIEGITVIYNEPGAADFDIDFKTMEPKCSPHANTDGTFRDHPTAHAIVDHRERAHKFKEKDPEGRATLQFALGARIVGVTFSERTHGTWCFGYHDGDKGYFPASAVAIDHPPRTDVPAGRNTTLIATAKWDHKPKEKGDGWLIFKKGDKITNIDFTSEDAWCWYGHHKTHRGYFPACFVQDLKQGPTSGQPGAVPARRGSGNVSPRGHTGIGSFIRRRTTANSMAST